MYIPASFRVDSEPSLFDFIDKFSFGTLVSVLNDTPFASHVPFLLDRGSRCLLAHLARANPHSAALEQGVESLAIFQGPHAYVSPSWYETEPAVPTWNYTAVHVYGTPQVITDQQALSDIVDRLVDKYEADRETPWPNQLPEEFRTRMLGGIIGFEIPINTMEG